MINYNGAASSILENLVKEQIPGDKLPALVYEALNTKNNNLLDALIIYADQINYSDNILKDFSFQDFKNRLSLLNDHFSTEKLLQIIFNKYVPHKYLDATSVIDPEQVELQGEIIKMLLDSGKYINYADIAYINIEVLYRNKELLLNHPTNSITPNQFLKFILFHNYSEHEIQKIQYQGELIQEAFNRNAIFDRSHNYLTIEMLFTQREFFFDNLYPISEEKFLETILHASIEKHDTVSGKLIADQEKLSLQGKLIAKSLDQKINIEDIDFYASFINPAVLLTHKDLFLNHPRNSISQEKFLDIVLSQPTYSENINGTLVIDQREKDKKSLIEQIILEGADLSTIFPSEDENLSLLERLILNEDFENVDLALKVKPDNDYKISLKCFIGIIMSTNISVIAKTVERFPNDFSPENAYETLRALGISPSSIDAMIDLYNLAHDYVKTTTNQDCTLLSEVELTLIDPLKKSLDIEAYLDNKQFNNVYGFSALALALWGHKIELAIQMIESGFSLVEKSKNGITPLQIIAQIYNVDNNSSNALHTTVLKHLDNVDIIINNYGESITDHFLDDQKLQRIIIDKSYDPLYYFFKEEADLFAPSKEPEKIHIAISHGENFWSTGIEAFSRLICNRYPELTFHVVTLEMIQKGGDDFIKQFNGWINSGAGDSYPNHTRFTKKDWSQSTSTEQIYQTVLDKTLAFKIPYIGICAGAQNLVLYHDGTIQSVRGYSQGQHQVKYIAGTLSHFIAMTKEQQYKALESCDLPFISFKGDTAHYYAAVHNKLGKDIELGALSEDGIAMSYAHINGLQYGTQFHPEHHYKSSTIGMDINHQLELWENFIHIARLHNFNEIAELDHPETILAQIHARLQECTQTTNCLVGETTFSDLNVNTMFNQWFNGTN